MFFCQFKGEFRILYVFSVSSEWRFFTIRNTVTILIHISLHYAIRNKRGFKFSYFLLPLFDPPVVSVFIYDTWPFRRFKTFQFQFKSVVWQDICSLIVVYTFGVMDFLSFTITILKLRDSSTGKCSFSLPNWWFRYHRFFGPLIPWDKLELSIDTRII